MATNSFGLTALLAASLLSCSSNELGRDPDTDAGGSSGAPSNPASGGSGGTSPDGSGGQGSPGVGGTAASGSGDAGAAGDVGSAGMGGNGIPAEPPRSCADAAAPYALSSVALDAALVPDVPAQGWNATLFAVAPVTSHLDRTYVGFTEQQDGVYNAVIAPWGGSLGSEVRIPNAVLGGIVATDDGVAALVFDPNPNPDERRWASVHRLPSDGSAPVRSDLFRSANLEVVGSKGAPTTSRLGYVPASGELIAYFGHTERYDDGVRHQGGYLASVDETGAVQVLSDWFGSHNLDQRLLVDDSEVWLLGLGDAYPKGIFFSSAERARTQVLYPLAANGTGSTNGQLGGAVDLGPDILVPFITNQSLPQDFDAGVWPDIDEARAQQIEDAAANGTDLGILRLSKQGTLPEDGLSAQWVNTALEAGARLESLKSARYGAGDLILLGWAEARGRGRDRTATHYTMVIDPTGVICQPKIPVPPELAFTGGDDILRRADGSIVWANPHAGRVNLVTLTPGS